MAVAVQTQGQLGHVIETEGEPVEVVQELVGEQCVGGNLAHRDHFEAVLPRRRPFSARSAVTPRAS